MKADQKGGVMGRSTQQLEPPASDVDDDEDLPEDEDEEPAWECSECSNQDEPCQYESGCCISCCDCLKCIHCGEHDTASLSVCGDCHNCEHCGCPCDDEYSTDGDGRVFSTQPPWEMRGVTVLSSDIQVELPKVDDEGEKIYDLYGTITASRTVEVACEEWGVDRDIDICQNMADFYLLEGISHLIFNGGKGNTVCEMIAEDARTLLDQMVDRLDATFIGYVDMVVGGELRHHPSMAPEGRIDGSRPAAWRQWRRLRELLGPDALVDAAVMFREFGTTVGSSGVGGERWAQAADLLHARLTGRIDRHIWVDRVFTMQHNGGSLLNKIQWKVDNTAGWTIDHVKSTIGPAQAANPTFFPVLLYAATAAVRSLFADYWKASNRARRDSGRTVTPMPSTLDDAKFSSHKMCWYLNGRGVQVPRGQVWANDPGMWPVPDITEHQWALAKAIWRCDLPWDDYRATITLDPRSWYGNNAGNLPSIKNPRSHIRDYGCYLESCYGWYAEALRQLVEAHQFTPPDTSELDGAFAWLVSFCWGSNVGAALMDEAKNWKKEDDKRLKADKKTAAEQNGGFITKDDLVMEKWQDEYVAFTQVNPTFIYKGTSATVQFTYDQPVNKYQAASDFNKINPWGPMAAQEYLAEPGAPTKEGQ